jgi:hypothetical protein
MPLLSQILLSFGFITTYILSLVVFHKYKIRKITNSFNPPNLWPIMNELYAAIDSTIGDVLEDICLSVNVQKGSFYIYKIRDFEFINYYTFSASDFSKTEKLSENSMWADYKRGFYEMVYRNNGKMICVFRVDTSEKLTQEKLDKVEEIIVSYQIFFISIKEYADQMQIML